MFYRRRLLLALLESLDGEANLRDFQKHAFLLTRGQSRPSYDFIPYRCGCYSFTLEADRKALIHHGWLCDRSDWVLDNKLLLAGQASNPHSALLTSDDQTTLELHTQRWGTLRGSQLVREVYTRYPFFATRSEVADQHLSRAELLKVHECKPAPMPGPALFTIGYQSKSFESYLQQLINSQVNVLCDVRRNPTSRKMGFSGGPMRRALNGLGIEYRHFPHLGIASDARRNLQTPSDYEQLFAEYHQTTLQTNATDQRAIVQLLAQHKRVALTCFELEPHQCHRSSLAKAIIRIFTCQDPQSLTCNDL
ncbi:MAG: DUF488 domain-containing protein [Caldilineaceae bacterium SB0666_bin_21]|nr:DUF488 domain-containing protein [Caldilineaceae bacterium SB0666_bin_21]